MYAAPVVSGQNDKRRKIMQAMVTENPAHTPPAVNFLANRYIRLKQ
jgi:hypothetical protein